MIVERSREKERRKRITAIGATGIVSLLLLLLLYMFVISPTGHKAEKSLLLTMGSMQGETQEGEHSSQSASSSSVSQPLSGKTLSSNDPDAPLLHEQSGRQLSSYQLSPENIFHPSGKEGNNGDDASGTAGKDGTIHGKDNFPTIEGLEGRRSLYLPSPKPAQDLEGKITVEIAVDPEGNIVSARAGIPRTTVYDSALNELLEKELKKQGKFTADPEKHGLQYGKVIFVFQKR